ncbi:MAG: toprim domain-containing protein [Planctomycetia bacterium]|nr:toprim domain-containing protein [Planctomycetia bacterium]
MSERPFVSFAEVKQKVSVPDVLAAFGILDRFRRRGDVLTGVCPLPGHKHGPSPNADQWRADCRKGIWQWYCFGDCQRGGDVVELAKALTGYDNAHVRFWFAERFGDRLSGNRDGPKKTKPETAGKRVESDAACERPPMAGSQQAASPSTRNLPVASAELKPLRFRLNLDPDVPYLRDRGVLPETIARFGLGLCRKGVLKDYVAIPVYRWPREAGENPVAYLGRWPGDDYDDGTGRPRYKWPDGFAKSQVVYGLAEALDGTEGRALIVVEGPFKVFHLVQCGFPNAVATFGSSLSREQAAILAATGRPIVLLFDGDAAGRRGARKAVGRLVRRTFVRIAALAQAGEADDLDGEALAELVTF